MTPLPLFSTLFPYTTLFRSLRAIWLLAAHRRDFDMLLVLREKLVPAKPEACRSQDRKSTRLNSSHVRISYAVFCLKKKRDETVEDSRVIEALEMDIVSHDVK